MPAEKTFMSSENNEKRDHVNVINKQTKKVSVHSETKLHSLAVYCLLHPEWSQILVFWGMLIFDKVIVPIDCLYRTLSLPLCCFRATSKSGNKFHRKTHKSQQASSSFSRTWDIIGSNWKVVSYVAFLWNMEPLSAICVLFMKKLAFLAPAGSALQI